MDDKGIAGKIADGFIEILEAVFQRIREAGMKLSMAKSHFGVQQIEYLGRTITPKGISPINEKVEKFLENLSMPSNIKQTQRFIGFVNFYKDFIPRLSDKLLPFYKLLKSDVEFNITDEQKNSSDGLIEDLKKACNTSLRMPLPEKEFVIVTDASEHAAGYALMIEDYTDLENSTRKKRSYAPVMFGTKTFNPAQMKYSAYTKDFLGLYFAFDAFRHLIWGKMKPTRVLTDDKSLTRFFQAKHMAPSF